MKLFKISQNVNNEYDTYSDAVVCAKDEKEAVRIHPSDSMAVDKDGDFGYAAGSGGRANFEKAGNYQDWASNIKDVKVEYIGEAKKGLKERVICASFHAG